MPIHQCQIYLCDKKADDSPAQISQRNEPLANNQLLENLLADFNYHYHSKTNKSWAGFQTPSEDNSISNLLLQLHKAQIDLQQFGQELIASWQKLLDEQQLFLKAYLALFHYQQGSSNFLALALIPSSLGLNLDQELELQEVGYLDLSNMLQAARINLDEWHNKPDASHAISLLKNKGGKKLSDAFLQLLQASESSNAVEDTRTLLKAFSDYVEQADLDEEHSQHKTKELISYANEQSRQGQPLALNELSEVLDEENPRAFYQHIRNKDYGLSDYIPADRGTIRQFQRFTGRAEGISISFAAHLLGSRIEYDAEQDTLIIRQPPSQLRDQLKRQQ